MTATTSGERVGAWRHVRAIALLPFVNTAVVPGALLTLFPPAPMPSNAAATMAGIALVVCGLALVVHTVSLFVRFGAGTLAPWDPTRELVTTGAYRYSRNPMKAGLFLVLGGEALLTQSVALAAWFACFTLVNVAYIRLHEEPKLAKRFGARYGDYCARVPRWWPLSFLSRRSEAR